MSEKKIVVPEGMLKAVDIAVRRSVDNNQSIDRNELVSVSTEAALRWLSENPIVPYPEQWQGLFEAWNDQIKASETLANSPHPIEDQLCFSVIEWQRRMFLAPEPEIPDQIKDLIRVKDLIREQTLPTGQWYTIGVDVHNQAILEAFRRGQKAGPQ